MFKEIIRTDPNDPLLYFGLGQEYFSGGKFGDAARAFENAVRLNPNYSAAYRYYGESLEKAGRLKQAEEIYKKGITVAGQQGDLEAGKAMQAFLKRVQS